MTDLAFNKLTTNIIDSATAMKQEVAGFSSLAEAIKAGYGTTLLNQLSGVIATCRALEKMMQSNVPKGGYSMSLNPDNETLSERT